jgi:hypothetical protein
MLAKVLETPESKRLKPETFCETIFGDKVKIEKHCNCTVRKDIHYQVIYVLEHCKKAVYSHDELKPV